MKDLRLPMHYRSVFARIPVLVFLEFLVFLSLRGFPCFLRDIAFFSRDFRGSVDIKILVFIVFLAFFQKTRKGRTGIGVVPARQRNRNRAALLNCTEQA